MQRAKIEDDRAVATETQPAPRDARRGRERHTRRVVFGLTGLLGAVWAVVIATRSGFLPG